MVVLGISTLAAAGGTRSCVKSEPPTPRKDDVDHTERLSDRPVAELIRRIVEAGVEKLSEGPENVRRVVGDLKLPREALAGILSQLDETKSGLYRVVAREVRDILEHTSLADELAKALTAVSFEIRTTVRFVPNEARASTPEVRSSVGVRRADASPEPPAAPPTPAPEEAAPANRRGA